jgi:putative addiction module killer protein
LRIDFGPGYRVYLGLDGAELVILLGGSDQARQSAAIAEARGRRCDDRRRKRRGVQETG